MSKASPAVAASVSWEQVLRWRIHRQLLAAERGTDLVGVVRRQTLVLATWMRTGRLTRLSSLAGSP